MEDLPTIANIVDLIHHFRKLIDENETFDDCGDFPNNIIEYIWKIEEPRYGIERYHLLKLTNGKYVYCRIWISWLSNKFLTDFYIAKDILTLVNKAMRKDIREKYLSEHPISFVSMLDLIETLGTVTLLF